MRSFPPWAKSEKSKNKKVEIPNKMTKRKKERTNKKRNLPRLFTQAEKKIKTWKDSFFKLCNIPPEKKTFRNW